MAETDNTEVVNDAEHHRLVLPWDGREGELTYERRSNQLILVHTEVPKELEGKGVGSLLVKAACRYVGREGRPGDRPLVSLRATVASTARRRCVEG